MCLSLSLSLADYRFVSISSYKYGASYIEIKSFYTREVFVIDFMSIGYALNSITALKESVRIFIQVVFK